MRGGKRARTRSLKADDAEINLESLSRCFSRTEHTQTRIPPLLSGVSVCSRCTDHCADPVSRPPSRIVPHRSKCVYPRRERSLTRRWSSLFRRLFFHNIRRSSRSVTIEARTHTRARATHPRAHTPAAKEPGAPSGIQYQRVTAIIVTVVAPLSFHTTGIV